MINGSYINLFFANICVFCYPHICHPRKIGLDSFLANYLLPRACPKLVCMFVGHSLLSKATLLPILIMNAISSASITSRQSSQQFVISRTKQKKLTQIIVNTSRAENEISFIQLEISFQVDHDTTTTGSLTCKIQPLLEHLLSMSL